MRERKIADEKVFIWDYNYVVDVCLNTERFIKIENVCEVPK